MLSRIEVVLPTLHVDQVRAYEVIAANRFVALRCGRRWGKTDLDKTLACDDAIKRKSVGWFAPEYKFISEAYNEISEILSPVIKSSSKTEGVIRTISGGRIDFWSLENERAGRSRKYHRAIIDEAAFAKTNMLGIWEKSIRPTLLDFRGTAVVTSNTNGVDADNFLYAICHEPRYGFVQFQAPTANNPYMPPEEVARLQADNHPLVYQQEYLAEFVDWSGVSFFSREKLLLDGAPVPWPVRCDAVFAVIDSATKTGTANDGTGCVYYAYMSVGATYQLVILDWELFQIQGAMLEVWLPTVFQNLEHMAKVCGARQGSAGAMIEDKSSGMVLIQHAVNRNQQAQAIDSKLTSVGKDERAISVSGYVYRELVKLSSVAYDKVVTYKESSRNHLLGQVTGFRVGDKDAAKREDDLLDAFCYGVAIALGNADGF